MMKRRDAMEEFIIVVGAGTFCIGSLAGAQVHHAIEPGVWDQPQDMLQVD
jgi:hypothetical protein